MLDEFGPHLYIANGPPVSFLGIPYPTRMAVVRLANGDLWIWSPIALSPGLESALDALGPVRQIVSPNKIHHLSLPAWAERWPEARLLAPPGLAQKRPEIPFDGELADGPDPTWADDIDQVIFHGSFFMEEVVFFHRASRTAIVGDLVQRFDPETLSGWRKLVMRLDGLVGRDGSTPREWRATFLDRRRARQARERLLDWRPERLVIAHGACAVEDATPILARALAWM
jgi:hypothetical protein